jgi:hypothetical protein
VWKGARPLPQAPATQPSRAAGRITSLCAQGGIGIGMAGPEGGAQWPRAGAGLGVQQERGQGRREDAADPAVRGAGACSSSGGAASAGAAE